MKTIEAVRAAVKKVEDENQQDNRKNNGLLQLLDLCEHEALIEFLPEYYKKRYRAKCPTLTRETVIGKIKEYLEEVGFAKALDHRGISTGRTIEKLKAWLWLLDEWDLIAFAEDDHNYENYGVPIMKRVAKALQIPVPEGIEKWVDGEKCCPECEEGCG